MNSKETKSDSGPRHFGGGRAFQFRSGLGLALGVGLVFSINLGLGLVKAWSRYPT